MSVLLASILMVISFVLLASLLLYMMIHDKVTLLFKVVAIPLIIWYGVFLYNAPPSFMGWATDKPIPKNSFIHAVVFDEPSDGDTGGIYLWVRSLSTSTTSFEKPRAYKLPYSIEMHRELMEKMNKSHESQGYLVYEPDLEMDKDKEENLEEGAEENLEEGESVSEFFEDDSGFQIINPNYFLRKNN